MSQSFLHFPGQRTAYVQSGRVAYHSHKTFQRPSYQSRQKCVAGARFPRSTHRKDDYQYNWSQASPRLKLVGRETARLHAQTYSFMPKQGWYTILNPDQKF
eukprot:27008-Amphidinium_carterae.3